LFSGLFVGAVDSTFDWNFICPTGNFSPMVQVVYEQGIIKKRAVS